MEDKEIINEIRILWKYKFSENLKEQIIRDIRGYFDIGKRANNLIKELKK